MTDPKRGRRRPTGPGPQLPIEVKRQIEKLCDEFQQGLHNDDCPKIEDYLARSPAWPPGPQAATWRGVVLGKLLDLELGRLHQQGARIDTEQYLRRFPADTEVVRAALERGLADSLDETSLPSTHLSLPPSRTTGTAPGGPKPTGTGGVAAGAPRGVAAGGPGSQVNESIPETIGRYQIQAVLGEGKYGRVYHAHDPQLNRPVALKVPSRQLFESGASVEAFLHEARSAAMLKHSGIVAVYDVQQVVQQDGQQPYIVQEYIDGMDLEKWARRERLGRGAIVARVTEIAEAAGFAHEQGLIHRDLKPGNILIDGKGHAHITDFGLAQNISGHESAQKERKREVAGTPLYMSPEQVRGESHRLDGGTDIWSLGVILYELLTGKPPFHGSSRNELFKKIENADPRPLRQRDPTIAEELERICLKCLEKRRSNRYSSAAELVEDLRHWSSQQGEVTIATAAQAASIVPRGLRSFDESDADFFLELLPGPRDRDGLPESIRFWKTRIEQTDADKTFSVGLIYGPSGCGKSSLIKAGLLPRLARHVLPLYIEATPDDTEARLLKGLAKHLPSPSPGQSLADVSLADVLRQLRERAGPQKILIVLDQFEQWLHAKQEQQGADLVSALRQCDGEHVQCIVMLRDDFWMAATQFMRDLEINLEAQNSAAVDLFPVRHAEKVLAAFGRVFGAIPEETRDLAADQREFIQQSVEGLAENGKVICVRLALFAEMMKGKTWTPATLQAVGGAKGVGVTFLDETFSASTAPPQHRYHQKAARAVLSALLPKLGTNIKGQMKSYHQLLKASGYAHRPQDFDELLKILDSEIRLITPTEPELKDDGRRKEEGPRPKDEGNGSNSSFRYYQLTHDYLVHSLRDWLAQKQKETRSGRAQLRLAELASMYAGKPESRHLPTWWETLNIRCLTRKRDWTPAQKTVMRSATRYHGLRWGAAICLLLIMSVTVQQFLAHKRRENDWRRAESLVDALLAAPPAEVPYVIEKLHPLREHGRPALQAVVENASNEPIQRLHAAYGLAAFDQPNSRFVVSQIRMAPRGEFTNIVRALQQDKSEAATWLHREARLAHAEQNWMGEIRLAIVALYLSQTDLAEDVTALSGDPVQRTLFIAGGLKSWRGDLNELAEIVRHLKQAPIQSAVALGVGNMAAEELSASAKAQWSKLLLEWFQRHPEGSVRSAADWTLRQWKIPPPKVAALASQSQRNWFVNKAGVIMLKIPAGSFSRAINDQQQRVRLSKPFYLSDREISVAQFMRFVNDPTYPTEEKPEKWRRREKLNNPTDDCPILEVNWYDALLYCNWLSRQEERKPCYERTGEKEKYQDVFGAERQRDVWRIVPHANGYRLPTEAEWEYACRAKSKTAFCFGDVAAGGPGGVAAGGPGGVAAGGPGGQKNPFLESYAVYNTTVTQPCGNKIPNGWGLFDMHGNAWEWCQDSYQPTPAGGDDPLAVNNTAVRVMRGGGWNSPAESCRTASRLRIAAGFRSIVGFRLAAAWTEPVK